jgi:copper chaperone CopZ
MWTTTYSVPAMRCAHCDAAVRSGLDCVGSGYQVQPVPAR